MIESTNKEYDIFVPRTFARKCQVEECSCVIDVGMFIGPRGVYAGKDVNGTLFWEDNSVGMDFELARNENNALVLEFDYNIEVKDRAFSFSETVNFSTRRMTSGGLKHFFVCPNPDCGREARKLYLPPGNVFLGCQKCLNLGYRCQQVKDSNRPPLSLL